MVVYYTNNPWCSYENFFDEDSKEENEEEKERRERRRGRREVKRIWFSAEHEFLI